MVGIFGKQVLSKKALSQFPTGGEEFPTFEYGMNPCDFPRCAVILYSVSRLWVIFHNLSTPASAFCVYLEIDDIACGGYAQTIKVGQSLDNERINEC